MDIIEQQQVEMVRHCEEKRDLLARTETGIGKETMKVRLPMMTLSCLNLGKQWSTLLLPFMLCWKISDPGMIHYEVKEVTA